MQKTGGGLDLACWLHLADPWWTRLTFPVVSPCFLNPLLCLNTTLLQNLLSCTLEPALNDPWCPPVLLGDTPLRHCHSESGRMDSTADLSCPLEATNLFHSFSVSLLGHETSRPHLFKPCASSSIQIITPSPSSPRLCSLLTLGAPVHSQSTFAPDLDSSSPSQLQPSFSATFHIWKDISPNLILTFLISWSPSFPLPTSVASSTLTLATCQKLYCLQSHEFEHLTLSRTSHLCQNICLETLWKLWFYFTEASNPSTFDVPSDAM